MSERSQVSALATWVGGQIKALGNAARNLRVGSKTGLVPLIYCTQATTTSTGAISVTIPAGYFPTAVVAANIAPLRDTATASAATFATTRSRTQTSVTGQVWESKSSQVLVLNTMVEGIEPSGAGIVCDVFVLGY